MLPGPRKLPEIPPFRSAGEINAIAAPAMRPPARVSVSECANEHRKLNNKGAFIGSWRNAPGRRLLDKVMDACDNRAIDTVVYTAPAQVGSKTEVILNVLGHGIKYKPRDALVVQPSQALCHDFTERRLNRMLVDSPDYGRELSPYRGDDKVETKVFKNSMRISMRWPTAKNFASVPAALIVIDERDSIPDDIEGEGEPVVLLRQRTKTFGRNALVLVVSSIKRNDYSGIQPLYDSGDRNIAACPCPHCGEWWTPGFDADRKPTAAHLSFPPGQPARATLICPACGTEITEDERKGMLQRAEWLPAGGRIENGRVVGQLPSSTTASFWLHGFAAERASLAGMAKELDDAEREYERTGNEEPLKTVYNTTFNMPYKPKASASDNVLDEAALKAKGEDYPLQRVPSEARFLTAQVDVQGNRFDCMTIAWGVDGQSWVIDLFQIFIAANDDGTERMVAPAQRAEDWDLLIDHIIHRAYPIEGLPGRSLKPRLVAIDSHGEAGVTGQAYEFWWRCRAKGRLDQRLMLLRGGPNDKGPPVNTTRQESDRRDRRLLKGLKLSTINTSALKDMVSTRLRRAVGQAGCIRVSKHLDQRFWTEATAEMKTKEGWIKLRSRNEAWDLLVYGLAAFIRCQGFRINWASPPSWAAPLESNSDVIADRAATGSASGDGAERPAAAMPAGSMPSAPSTLPPPHVAAAARARSSLNDWLDGRVGRDWL